MKPLRDLVLIELEEAVVETKRESGIILLSTQNNMYQIGDDESKLKDLISKPKMNKGNVLAVGSKCQSFKVGANVIYKKGMEQSYTEVDGKKCAFVKEKDILTVSDFSYINPDYVLVKITKEAREELFNKKITRDDGTEVLLFIGGDKGEDDNEASQIFVSSGEVVKVGDNLPQVSKGDIALLSYLCDNDKTIIVGYDGEDKIIAVQAVTTLHKEQRVVHANRAVNKDGKRVGNRDQIVWDKGQYDELASLYGVVSGEKLIAIEPYVFLNHEDAKTMKVGKGGIIYEEDEKFIQRTVLAVSSGTSEIYGLKNEDSVLLDDYDLFTIQFGNKKISCVNDCDILYK